MITLSSATSTLMLSFPTCSVDRAHGFRARVMTRGPRGCQPHRVTSGCQTVGMRRGWGVLGFVAMAAVTAAGCGSGSHLGVGGGGSGGGGKVYTTSPIDVKTGDDFTISLEANPSTGYSWELTG